MAYNFNNYSNEYQLYNGLTAELIDLYGFTTTYIKTEKVNPDVILGEIQNLRANDDSVFFLNVYPENTSGFDNQNDLLSKFGILSFDSINLFVSSLRYVDIYPSGDYQKGVGDLIILPSKKVFEITDIEHQVQGVNNMFVYANQKNVYMLKCKPYNYNHDEIVITDPDLADIVPDFTHLFDIADKQAEAAEQNTQSTLVKNIDPVFGDLG